MPAPKRRMAGGTNIFLLVALIIAGIAVVLSGLVFAYDRYLSYVADARAADLAKAQSSVSQDTVKGFVRLRDRFVAGKTLLNNHVVLSQLFDVLENITLQNVRYTNLKVSVAADRTATLDVNGIAKNFNTLAAQSNTIAADARFKRAIFSGIVLNADNTVGFHLTALIDPKLVVIGAAAAGTAVPPPAAPMLPAATSTPVSVPVPAAAPASTTKP